MLKKLKCMLTLFLWFFTICATHLAFSEENKTEIQKYFKTISSQIGIFNSGDILYDRLDSQGLKINSKKRKQDIFFLKELFAKKISDSDLIELLKNNDAKVRTLALAALFAKENPKHLPVFVRMTEDFAETFPKEERISLPLNHQIKSIPTVKQTVADIALQMVKFYLERANYFYGTKGTGNCPGFEDYWSKRKEHHILATWISVRMGRATQGTSPIPKGREHKFLAIKQEIEQLKNPERLWYRFYTGTLEGGEKIYSKQEVLESAQLLGAEQLLLLLSQKVPITDPDLTQLPPPQGCGGYTWLGSKMVEFVLNNAKALLRSKDALFLLRSPFYKTKPIWPIATAQLAPSNAEVILKEAMFRFNEGSYGWQEARLAAALYRISGISQLGYVIDWYYNEPMGENRTTAHQIFIGELLKGEEHQTKLLIETLIKDQRFEIVNKEALVALIDVINQWLPAPLIKNSKSLRLHEKERMKRWKQQLLDSIPRWKSKEKRIKEK